MKIRSVDMDSPKLFRTIVLYCIPLVISSLIQSLFSSVDMIMINAFDPSSVAAIGATTSILHLMLHAFLGISTGVSVVVAFQYGQKNEKGLRDTISTAMIFGGIMGCLLAVIGTFLTPWLLQVTNCPSDIMTDSATYLQIYLLSSPAVVLCSFGSVLLTTSGDTQRPMYYGIISGLMNVILNFVLLLVLPNKIAAVAIATVVSQIMSAALTIVRLVTMKGACRWDIRHITWSFGALKKILLNGVPAALLDALYPFANLQVQSQINVLGSAVVAGSAASSGVENFAGIVYGRIGGVTSTFVGYNLGAQRTERIKKTIRYCVMISMVSTLVLDIFILVFARQIAALYVTEEIAVEAMLLRMRVNITLNLITALGVAFGGAIKAFGYTFLVTVGSVLSIFVFRIFWMYVVYPPHCDLTAPLQSLIWIVICWPISLLISLICNLLIFCYLYYFRFKRGTLRRIA